MQINDFVQALNAKFSGVVLEEQKEAVVIPRDMILPVVEFLKAAPFLLDSLHCVTAVDRIEKIEMVYIFYSMSNRTSLMLKTRLENCDLNVESLAGLYRSADWLEREVYDLFGVRFLNHPDLRRILNPDEWTDFPLRKNFSRPDFIKKPETLGLKGGG